MIFLKQYLNLSLMANSRTSYLEQIPFFIVLNLSLISKFTKTIQKYTEVNNTWQQLSGGITFVRRSFLALPPSAKFLYVLLKSSRRLSRQDLISKTFLPPRTVNYGLSRLKDLGLIEEEEHEKDARERVYLLTSTPM